MNSTNGSEHILSLAAERFLCETRPSALPTSSEIEVVSNVSTIKEKIEATDENNHLPEATLNHDPEEWILLKDAKGFQNRIMTSRVREFLTTMPA
jgi:hypothetical protein